MKDKRFSSIRSKVESSEKWAGLRPDLVKLTIQIPSETHKGLKMVAASKSVHMRDIVLVVLEDYLRKNRI